MIFNCGPTWEETKARRGQWHDFFAIWPRVVLVVDGEQHCAWLQTIQRRSTYHSCMGEGWWENQYRLKPGASFR